MMCNQCLLLFPSRFQAISSLRAYEKNKKKKFIFELMANNFWKIKRLWPRKTSDDTERWLHPGACEKKISNSGLFRYKAKCDRHTRVLPNGVSVPINAENSRCFSKIIFCVIFSFCNVYCSELLPAMTELLENIRCLNDSNNI